MAISQPPAAPPTPAGDLFTFDTIDGQRYAVPAHRVAQLTASRGQEGVVRVELRDPHNVLYAEAEVDELRAQLARLRGQGRADNAGQGSASTDPSAEHYRSDSAGTGGPTADPVSEAWKQDLNGVREEFRGDRQAFEAYARAKQAGRVHVAGQAEATTPPPPVLPTGTDAELRARFANSPQLRAEFRGDVESFLAFVRAQEAGRVAN